MHVETDETTEPVRMMTGKDDKFRPDNKFYGRIKGVRLSARQAGLVEDLLPKVRVDLSQPLSFAQNDVWLEIGFGGGEHLAWQATHNLQTGIIGAEPFINGIAKLLVAIAENGLNNVRIHDTDARTLVPAIPDGSLSRIYLLYPDPWHKQRHRKRRFVNDETIGQFHRMLKPGGLFRFASDIEDYVNWTVSFIDRHGGFDYAGNCPADWRQPFEDWQQTRYEKKALREGRQPSYLSFVKR